MGDTVDISSEKSHDFDESMSDSSLFTELKEHPFDKLNALKETTKVRMLILKKKSKILKTLIMKHPLENNKVLLEEFKRNCGKVFTFCSLFLYKKNIYRFF